MIRSILLSFVCLFVFIACFKSNKSASLDSKHNSIEKSMDTVYLTNPQVDSDHKPLIISLSSNSTNDAVDFNVGNIDTLKIKILGISNYPIHIKEKKNILLSQLNDSLFHMHVLDTMVYFEIWQDYGEGNVLRKVQYSVDSFSYLPYNGIKPVGRIK